MLNRKPRAALRCCTLAFLCFSGRLVTEVLSAPLPQDSTRPGDTIGRFVVSFDEHNKQAIKQHLLREGYNIVSDGGGFFAITHRGSVKESLTAAAVTRAAAPATAGLGDSREAAAAQVLSKSSSKGRRLLQRKQQQEAAEHLLALQRVPGIGSSEQDLPRFLHMRLSGKQGSSSTTGSRSTSSTAAAAEAATRRDRHSAASASRAGAGQAAAALAAAHLTGHWHSSGSLRPARYDLWGNSIGDQQCANNDTRLSDAAGAEILPWGVKAIGAANETLLKAQPQGRAIVCIIDSGLERDHPEYKSFPGQLSGCQAGANCPFKWSNDIVGHGTHVAGKWRSCSASQPGRSGRASAASRVWSPVSQIAKSIAHLAPRRAVHQQAACLARAYRHHWCSSQRVGRDRRGVQRCRHTRRAHLERFWGRQSRSRALCNRPCASL
eukprot:GHRQ01019406.1.p1 GENE.GHRQ01019406.1~~GHRQ01019406.1.p1  ORF type:complete len:436 (+),score=47.37 GHRQ01019406.1:404-1711(+)